MKVLEIAEHARLQIAFIGHPDADAAARRLPARVVHLVDLAVAAIFAEVAGAEECLHAIGGAVVELDVEVAVRDGRVVVDDPLFARRDDRESVRIEHAAVDADAEPVPDVAADEVELRAVVVAVLRFELERAPRRTRADDVDDAAHRVVAVQARAAAVHHLDPIGALQRHARPVHPAAERIVERRPVDEDERPAHAARPDAAQRHTLRRRVRRQAARPAEQAERGNLPQDVVGHYRRRRFDVVARQHADARRDVAGPLLAARGRHRHGFENRSGRYDDLELAGAVARRHARGLFGEAARANDERHVLAVGRIDREAAVRTGHGLPLGAGRRLDDDRGADDGAAD